MKKTLVCRALSVVIAVLLCLGSASRSFSEEETSGSLSDSMPEIKYALSQLTESELNSLYFEIHVESVLSYRGKSSGKSEYIEVDYSKFSGDDFNLLLNAINDEYHRRKFSIESAISRMDDFFIECSKEGIYFSATKPSSEMKGVGKVNTLVRYESSSYGVAYNPFIRSFTDGSIQYGINSSCSYTQTNKSIYEIFVATVLKIDRSEADTLLNKWFMKSYLAGDTVNVCDSDYEISAYFRDSYRFFYITLK